MAMTRSQIELLITAKNQAQAAFDQLGAQIGKVAGTTTQANAGMKGMGESTKTAGVSATATGVAFGMLAERLARGLVGAFQSTIQAANRLDAGLIGLSSVANAFNQNADKAKAAAISLASDGLMSVGEAATALKNLLAAGFGLDQAITLVDRFKDTAAFGRQAALSFGQAITSATEGIKNGNSILVDNAGVTKNLSNMLVEAGFSAQDLSKATSDVNVRQALFNGILKESKPQLGDAARLLGTAAGQQAKFSSQLEIAQQKLGKALQPALLEVTKALIPFVQALGNAAPVLVPLGTALAAIVVPMAAMKVAAMAGIPPLSQMGTAFAALKGKLSVPIFSTTATQIGDMGKAATATTGILGKLQVAALAAGAAFVGWQIGKVINEVTGADKAFGSLLVKMGLYADSGAAATAAKQDVLNRAIAQGAAATISYADAVQFNADKELIRLATFDKSNAAQVKAIDAKVRLGQLDRAAADDLLVVIQAEERRNEVAKNRTTLTQDIIAAEQKVRAEIAQTGMTIPQLTAALQRNEEAFKDWAEKHGLSAKTIDYLNDQLKKEEDHQKKAAEAAKKHREEAEKLTQALEDQAGVITPASLLGRLGDLEKLLLAAAHQGGPALRTALQNLEPEFSTLIELARASGISVDFLRGSFDRFSQQAGMIVKPTRDFSQTIMGLVPAMQGASSQSNEFWRQIDLNVKATNKLNEAYDYFGMKTPQALRDAASAAARNYQALVEGGLATKEQLKAAWNELIDAQTAASGRLPSTWRTVVLPGITDVVQNIQAAVTGSFAQMVLGAKSFSEGWLDIWKSIKAGVLNILNEILQAFLNNFLKGMLGMLTGHRGAFSSAFGGLFGGGGGGIPGLGGGGGIPGLGGLFGGGGGAGGVLPSTNIGMGGMGGGGGIFGGLGAGIFGGLGAGAAGLGLGAWLSKYGKVAGIGGGMASGAATGAMIGSIVPGLGTAIGAIIGGLGGLFGGMFGKGEGKKVNKARDELLAQFGGAGTGAGSGFGTLAAELAKLSEGAGGGFGGGKLFESLIKADTMKEFERAVKAIQVALEGTEYATIKVRESFDQLNQTREQSVAQGQAEDDVIRQQATSYSQLLATIQATGATAPAAMQPILQSLIDMGLLVDANGKLITDLSTVKFEGMAQAGTAALDDVNQALIEGGTKWDEYAKRGGVVGKDLSDQLKRVADSAEGAADDIGRAFEGVDIRIPVRYDMPNLPNLPGGGGSEEPEPPGAASGVMASRPGLVLFGEGGEAELGGPASFFRKVFESLGIGTDGQAAGGALAGGSLIVNFSVNTINADGFRQVVEQDVAPMLLDIVRQNRRQIRTDMRNALGVT
jgi:hypothetical protein